MVESRIGKVKPMEIQLETISDLMAGEEQKIRRLVTETGKYDDNYIVETFRNEIELATKNYNSLKTEQAKISQQLLEVEFTIEQQDHTFKLARKIKSKLLDASFEQKRQIFDLLKVGLLCTMTILESGWKLRVHYLHMVMQLRLIPDGR
jgi:hypothetical protein